MHTFIYHFRMAGLALGIILIISVAGVRADEGVKTSAQDPGSAEQHLVLHLIQFEGEAPGKILHSLDLSFANHLASRSTLHFGTKVPIATTTFNFTQTDSSGVPIPVTSYTYQNLGFEVSANPYPGLTSDGQVVLGFTYELSYLSAADVDDNGTGSPVINTRESNRVLALAPGEKVMVAEFHKAKELTLLSECLGLGLAESECAGVTWQLSLELRSE